MGPTIDSVCVCGGGGGLEGMGTLPWHEDGRYYSVYRQ